LEDTWHNFKAVDSVTEAEEAPEPDFPDVKDLLSDMSLIFNPVQK